jgi:hypothetical protein
MANANYLSSVRSCEILVSSSRNLRYVIIFPRFVNRLFFSLYFHRREQETRFVHVNFDCYNFHNLHSMTVVALKSNNYHRL